MHELGRWFARALGRCEKDLCKDTQEGDLLFRLDQR
jgi:hypothetical protein